MPYERNARGPSGGSRREDEVGALWQRATKDGVQYLTGTINGVKVVAFPTRNKKSEKEPDFRVLKSQLAERQGQNNPHAATPAPPPPPPPPPPRPPAPPPTRANQASSEPPEPEWEF